MSVVRYRCPESGEEVTTAIETGRHVLGRMRAMGLSIWAWCPHCVTGHQIKPAEVILEDESEDEIRTAPSPSLAAG